MEHIPNNLLEKYWWAGAILVLGWLVEKGFSVYSRVVEAKSSKVVADNTTQLRQLTFEMNNKLREIADKTDKQTEKMNELHLSLATAATLRYTAIDAVKHHAEEMHAIQTACHLKPQS